MPLQLRVSTCGGLLCSIEVGVVLVFRAVERATAQKWQSRVNDTAPAQTWQTESMITAPAQKWQSRVNDHGPCAAMPKQSPFSGFWRDQKQEALRQTLTLRPHYSVRSSPLGAYAAPPTYAATPLELCVSTFSCDFRFGGIFSARKDAAAKMRYRFLFLPAPKNSFPPPVRCP